MGSHSPSRKGTRLRILGLLVASSLVAAGCATQFVGSAYIEGGRATCETKCKGQGMAIAGMVFMGEYSSACVCAPPGQDVSMSRPLLSGSAAVAGGATGVVMQMRRQEAAQQGAYQPYGGYR